MIAGLASRPINPPAGTRMAGFGDRDQARGVVGVHDDVCVRALYLEHGSEAALVLGYDLLFFCRENADRLKGALGRALDLRPRQVLVNCSHTHCGPSVGLWAYERTTVPDWDYLALVEARTLAAACEARDRARRVRLRAGAGRSRLPVSRRRLNTRGKAEWRPDREAEVCPHLPVCLIEDDAGGPIALLFSVSCHPSTTGGWDVSADYPGSACRRLDEHLGQPCSLFLQGAGGDAKPCVIAEASAPGGPGPSWRRGGWDDVDHAGAIVAGEVKAVVDAGLAPVAPALACAVTEIHCPLAAPPGLAELEEIACGGDEVRRLWAREQLQRLERDYPLPKAASLLVQGLKLGEGLRLIAVEGEPVGDLGRVMLEHYADGVTAPLGYSNGMGLYLPSSRMLAEGGYEVGSFHEFGYPARLAPGVEQHLVRALAELRAAGID